MYTMQEVAHLPIHTFGASVDEFVLWFDSLSPTSERHIQITSGRHHLLINSAAARLIRANLDAKNFAAAPAELKGYGVNFLFRGIPVFVVVFARDFDEPDVPSFSVIPAKGFPMITDNGKVVVAEYLHSYKMPSKWNKQPAGIANEQALPRGQFYSTKSYHHNVGLSCAFRQWRATHSHCSKLHGYSVAVSFIFGCSQLDDKNWAADFGGLKELKQWLEDTFDHKTVVAADDPHLDWFKQGAELGTLDLIILEKGVGCERFAELAFYKAHDIIQKKYGGRVWVETCEVREHEGNSAVFKRIP